MCLNCFHSTLGLHHLEVRSPTLQGAEEERGHLSVEVLRMSIAVVLRMSIAVVLVQCIVREARHFLAAVLALAAAGLGDGATKHLPFIVFFISLFADYINH